jgi:hypothetical protein
MKAVFSPLTLSILNSILLKGAASTMYMMRYPLVSINACLKEHKIPFEKRLMK